MNVSANIVGLRVSVSVDDVKPGSTVDVAYGDALHDSANANKNGATFSHEYVRERRYVIVVTCGDQQEFALVSAVQLTRDLEQALSTGRWVIAPSCPPADNSHTIGG